MFYDKTKKELLDRLTIEYVVPKIKEEAETISKEKDVIIDAPLLFETGLDKICDITIGVIADEETCVKRSCKRDGISEETAKARINSQNREGFFKINCDYCINNGIGENLEKQINEILSRKKFIKYKCNTFI